MKTFREFISVCEGYVPLRTSDQPYDDEGFPTRTRSWSNKMTNALINVGKQKFNSVIGVGDPINNLVKGVSAAVRLGAMKEVDVEPESVRAKRSQAKSQANQRLGADRRRLQTSMNRQHLTRSLRGGSSNRTPNTGTSSGNNTPRSASERSGLPRSFRPGAAGSGDMLAN